MMIDWQYGLPPEEYIRPLPDGSVRIMEGSIYLPEVYIESLPVKPPIYTGPSPTGSKLIFYGLIGIGLLMMLKPRKIQS